MSDDINLPGQYSLRQDHNTVIRDWYITITPDIARRIVAMSGCPAFEVNALDRLASIRDAARAEIARLKGELEASKNLHAQVVDRLTGERDAARADAHSSKERYNTANTERYAALDKLSAARADLAAVKADAERVKWVLVTSGMGFA